jgi:hypothetical protein
MNKRDEELFGNILLESTLGRGYLFTLACRYISNE